MESSVKGKLNKVDLKKILVGGGLAAGGALITYLADLLPQIEMNDNVKLISVAAVSILLNLIRKVSSGPKVDPRRV